MINNTDYRDSCASTDEEDDDTLFNRLSSNQPQTDDDSESEFNNILKMCRRHREFAAAKMEENSQVKPLSLNKRDKVFDSEYYSLPAIEQLNIQVKEETEFERFGVVESHINFLAKIRPDKDAPHLGYETILFDHDKKPVGEIFEIFGTVIDTLYALRFNDENEAIAKLPVGKVIYYASSDNAVTKPVFPKELAKLKNWERVRPSCGSSSSEEIFSDDEEEKRYLARKKHKNREDRLSIGSETNSSNVISKKRSRVEMNRLGRARAFNQPAYPRQIYPGSYTALPLNSYMPIYPQFPSFYHQPVAAPFYHQWIVPPPPPPNDPSNTASMPYSYSHSRLSFPIQNRQFFNQQSSIPQRPYFDGRQNEIQK